MKHVKLFEDFLFEVGGPFSGIAAQRRKVLEKISDYIKKSPLAKKSLGDCTTLYKAMSGSGTDEAAIYSVFSKIKTKGEIVQMMAIWDMCDYNYTERGQNILVNALRIFSKMSTGNWGEYDKKISGRLDRMGDWAKDTFNSLDFWNKSDTRANDAYLKARAEWYKKNPTQQETNLFFWLKEELDTEELAKLNGIIKKFGMQISS